MTAYGGKRFDFKPSAHTISLLEDWPLRWVVEDENGAAVSSLSGMNFGLAIMDDLNSFNGWTAIAAATPGASGPLYHRETVSGQTAPNVDITVSVADQATLPTTSQRFAYELWRTDASPNLRRIAYGYIHLVY